MNVSIKTRAVGGFAIVALIFSVAVALSLLALKRSNEHRQVMNAQILPLMAQKSAVLENQLQARIQLSRFWESLELTRLDRIEQHYRESQQRYQTAADTLAGLVANHHQQQDMLATISRIQAQMFAAGQRLINAHRQALQAADTVNRKKAALIDTMIEVIDYAISLEKNTNSAPIKTYIANLILMLDDARSTVLDTVESEVTASVLAAGPALEQKLGDIDRALQTLNSSGELAGTPEFISLQQRYEHFKSLCVGDESLLMLYLSELEQRNNALAALAAVDQAGERAIDGLNRFDTHIQQFNADVQSAAEQAFVSSRKAIVGLVLAALLATLVLAVLLARSLRGSLVNTVEQIQQLTRGDFSQPVSVHKSGSSAAGNDELDALTAEVHTLVTQLRSLLQALQSDAQQLKAATDQTATLSQQSVASLARQQDQTQTVADAIGAITTDFDTMSGTINSTLEQIDSADTDVNQGEALLKQNIVAIGNLADDIDRSTSVIQRLNQDTENIGSVLDVIRGVAEQTNLLALNAAIEAARAGEQGRGFAVVADEVRTLASRAHNSTEEIQAMIERLQAGAREAAGTMEKSREEVQTTVANIAQTGDRLRLVATAVNEIKTMGREMAEAAQQQASATQEQNRSINAVTELAQQTSCAVQQHQQLSEQLSQIVEHQSTLLANYKTQ